MEQTERRTDGRMAALLHAPPVGRGITSAKLELNNE